MDNEINLLKQVLNKAQVIIKLKDSGITLATAEVILGDRLNIRGYRVSKSESGGCYVQPPSIRNSNGTWTKIIWIEDKEIQTILNDIIIERYEYNLKLLNRNESNQDES